MEEEKQLKLVISGLPSDYPVEEIIDTLKGFKFQRIQCHPIRHRQTKRNLDLFLVTLPKITDSSNYRPPHGRINTQEIDRIFNQSNKGYNSKHRAWSRGRSNTNGTIIHDNIVSNNVVLLAPLEPTHFPYNHASSRTLNFGIMIKIPAGKASSHNDLSSDHNPVFFKLYLSTSPAKNTVLPIGKPTVKSFTIASQADNPKMDTTEYVGDCISKFTCFITTAINFSTKVQLIKGPCRQLPQLILDKMKIKNSYVSFISKPSTHLSKKRFTNFKRKFTKTLKHSTIIGGERPFKESTPKRTLSMT
ncbi:hypothetical protein AVEN_26086-1 [Araneus ventricosus]|uniref:Pre-C2HC domain-containing protein n=1 Tax=Araneus ventricosus TaxID=182803 RepID=A0A4Y2VAS7_ARAVE|nr:hypothetical protein AVEN_26086-1 [Araneus ventricosus]